ncbi:hypothetical protein B0H10DRAFT_986323 [Mycena sp. CBHHK59/15]|nr:hypothetical protein B0H10DRAFT_986323 [Mycena sp. CBHHK59/15]
MQGNSRVHGSRLTLCPLTSERRRPNQNARGNRPRPGSPASDNSPWARQSFHPSLTRTSHSPARCRIYPPPVPPHRAPLRRSRMPGCVSGPCHGAEARGHRERSSSQMGRCSASLGLRAIRSPPWTSCPGCLSRSAPSSPAPMPSSEPCAIAPAACAARLSSSPRSLCASTSPPTPTALPAPVATPPAVRLFDRALPTSPSRAPESPPRPLRPCTPNPASRACVAPPASRACAAGHGSTPRSTRAAPLQRAKPRVNLATPRLFPAPNTRAHACLHLRSRCPMHSQVSIARVDSRQSNSL